MGGRRRSSARRLGCVFGVLAAFTALAASPREAAAQCTITGTPVVLTDGSGFNWDIDTRGAVGDGTGDAFDIGMVLRVNGVDFPGSTRTTELSGRQIVHGPTSMSGLNVTRKAYVPTTDGWARFLEIFQNPTASSITIAVRIETNAGSDGSTVVTRTSSGDTLFSPADRWMCSDDFDGGGDPSLNFNYWGTGGSVAPNLVGTSVFDCSGLQGSFAEFPLTVPAGATRILMHFAGQRGTQAQVQANAAALDALPAAAVNGLTPTEIGAVVNWATAGAATATPTASPARPTTARSWRTRASRTWTPI